MQLYHTFISYSRADGEFALKLANDLRVAGVNIWLDQLDIPPGARWDRAVEDALETCGRLLIILSPTSAGSENVRDVACSDERCVDRHPVHQLEHIDGEGDLAADDPCKKRNHQQEGIMNLDRDAK